MNFNSSDSSNLQARRARIKELQAQGRVMNSSMRAKQAAEIKRMQKIEDMADNIIAGLQYNPNVKREVLKVEEVEYIDTTGFDIVNLGSADKDAYSNSRRAEYSKNKKLENMADAILKELQSDSDEDDNIDEDKMDSILNDIRNEDNNSDEDETDEDNNIDEDETDEDDNIDEEEMESIINMPRNDNADNYMDENDDEDVNYIDEDVIVEDDNNETHKESGYYEYSKLQERIIDYIVKHGSYNMKKNEYQKYFNEIQPLIEMNIVVSQIDESGDMITLFD